MPKAALTPYKTCTTVILELLPLGHPSIQQAAQKLSIPVRTLQRRLHDVGLTYSELVDQVRCEAACHLLTAENLCMAEITAALGFSDPSNFSRAFQRWKGMLPSQYRARSRINGAKILDKVELQADGAK